MTDSTQDDPRSALTALHQAGHLNEAKEKYEALLREAPASSFALAGLAAIHAQRGDFVKALDHYALALKSNPANVDAHRQRGVVLCQLGRFEEALESLTQAIALKPDSFVAYNNRGVVWKAQEQFEAALADYDRALAINPEYVSAWKNRGIVLRALQRLDECITSYDRALEISPQDAQIWNYRGHVLRQLGRLEDSLASYQEAVRICGDYAEAHYNQSIVLRELGRLTDAIACCDRATSIVPGYADAWWNKAEMLVLTGDFENGWAMFEWRWKSDRHGKEFREVGKPLWLGDGPLEGKRLLLNVDGGLGDVIQFCRYIPLLVRQGAQVIVEAQQGLIPLLRESFDSIELTPYLEPLPEFDCHCPQMSLPGAFRQSVDQLTADLPYLRAPALHREAWAAKLGPKTRPRIGLVWSGGNLHYKGQEHRSIPLEQMQVLLTPDAEFHCLQKEILESDCAALSSLPVRTWESELHDFAETAALISHMDLVISVDTAVAHLTGAMAQPVWTLLPSDPDMRWMLSREDTPWYPKIMRLFRQPSLGDWATPLGSVHAELLRWIG
ncbi:MAG: tetratricopeptide repeat protein [Verrucomicrobiota bacterium]